MQFLIGLLRYNDNSANRYADDYYRATLISALSNTLVAADAGSAKEQRADTSVVGQIAALFVRALNMDALKPSYGCVVAIAALRALLLVTRFVAACAKNVRCIRARIFCRCNGLICCL